MLKSLYLVYILRYYLLGFLNFTKHYRLQFSFPCKKNNISATVQWNPKHQHFHYSRIKMTI